MTPPRERALKAKGLALVWVLTLGGCGLLRWNEAPLIPLEDNPSIALPQFTDRVPVSVGDSGELYQLDGALLRALTIATNDFLPPESKDTPCALKRESQLYRVIAQGDVFFISISENLAHCGHTYPALDSGVRYAIHRDGRILRRRLDGQPEFPHEPPSKDDPSWVEAPPGVTSVVEPLPQDGGTPPLPDADGGTP